MCCADLHGCLLYPDDGQGPDRMCSITGGPEKIQMAANMIQDLVQTALAREVQFMWVTSTALHT